MIPWLSQFFLNPILAGGVFVAATPIIIHFAYRRRMIRVRWGAMRFLHEMFRRSRRRLFIEQWLLLATRAAVLLFLALALMRPQIPFDSAGNDARSIARHGRVASVLLIDNSLSTKAGRGETAMDAMKELGLSYIDTLQKGDELSIIPLSQCTHPSADPFFDLDAARDILQKLKPSEVESDVPALLEAGLRQFSQHLNPAQELVLLTDGMAEGWHFDDHTRWAELRKRFAPDSAASPRPLHARKLVVLAPADSRRIHNTGISDLRIDRTLVPAGRRVNIVADITHTGGDMPKRLLIHFFVNNRLMSERQPVLRPGYPISVTFDHTFATNGSHSVTVALEGTRDLLPADDRRSISVTVESDIPVLLVEGNHGRGIEGSLGLLCLALNPFDKQRSLFRPVRIPLTELIHESLNDYRAVVLGDIPALDQHALSKIERFVASGGRLLVTLGPNTDMALANRFWARGGDGILPAPLQQYIVREPPFHPVYYSKGHPAFAAFDQGANDALSSGHVYRYYKIDSEQVDPDELLPLLLLDNGDPLLVERRRGQGRVVLFTGSLDLQWSDMPLKPFFVPLIRGLIGYLNASQFPIRNLSVGERVVYIASHLDSSPKLTGPLETTISFEKTVWRGHSVYRTPPLLRAGVYHLIPTDQNDPVYYALTLPASECRFKPLRTDEIDDFADNMSAAVLRTPGKIASALSTSRRQVVELWHFFVPGAIAFLFFESVLTRRMSRMEGRMPIAPAESTNA